MSLKMSFKMSSTIFNKSSRKVALLIEKEEVANLQERAKVFNVMSMKALGLHSEGVSQLPEKAE